MGCAFLIPASFNLSCWKKRVSKIPNLLKHSEVEERKRHFSNIPMERGKSSSQAIHPSSPPPKAMHIIQAWLRGTKKVTLERNPFFSQAMMMHKRQIHPQMPGKSSVGNQPVGKQGEKWAQEIKPFEAWGFFSSSLLIFSSL